MEDAPDMPTLSITDTTIQVLAAQPLRGILELQTPSCSRRFLIDRERAENLLVDIRNFLGVRQ